MTSALTFYKGRVRLGSLSYDELAVRVAGTARWLEELGIGRGDRVAILSPNCLEVPVLLLAIWHVGAVAVPLNPTATPEDWLHILRHSSSRGCFAARDLYDAVASAPLELVRRIEECDRRGTAGALLPTASDEPAIILYTSGTTALPKGVMLSQRNLQENAWSLARNFSLSRDTQLAVLPLYHAHALGFGLMTSLCTGGHLVFTDRFDPLAWADVIRAESVTHTSLVPPMLPLLLQARVTRARVPTLEALLVSSAPLQSELAREVLNKSGLPLVHGWGLSEYTNFACCLSPQLDEKERRALLCDGDVPSVGSPLAPTEVTVRDADGRALGEGQLGELCVRGPSRMIGYYQDEAATRGTLLDDWLRTGDLGHYRVHGGRPHFFVTGRLKEIIIRDGEKYSPIAVEKQLAEELPELTGRLVVLGFAHALHGEEVGAYVETQEMPEALGVRILHAVERLPAPARPKIILHGAGAIPRTHTGKVQRRKLVPLFQPFARHSGAPRLIDVSSPGPRDSEPGSAAAARSRD
jgi:long-chain acyl-CoA synthetase